jgi:hypothetical protein
MKVSMRLKNLLKLAGNQSEARKEAYRGRGRGREGPPILVRYGKQPSGIGIEEGYGEEKREMQEDMRRGKTLIYLFDVGSLVSDCILSTDTEYGTASTRPIPRPAAGPHLHEPIKIKIRKRHGWSWAWDNSVADLLGVGTGAGTGAGTGIGRDRGATHILEMTC